MYCGLLGKKLGHSYSPQIHSYLGDYPYVLFEKQPEELGTFLKSGDFTGLNVTMPYKKEVIPYLDILSDRATELGAVNTIVRQQDGKLIGHNTDHFGFFSMLRRTGLDVSGKKVLVLGSGGASATAASVLKKENANVVIISRNGPNNYDNLHLHACASVIVNATPVGMYPNVGNSPLDINMFPDLEGVLDIVYNPARTQLLLDAEKNGLVAENGLWMLVAQAKESAEWFTGRKIPDNTIDTIYRMLRKQMENIVLIGMPGCGKTTIGRRLSSLLNKRFIDIDDEIVQQSGLTIPQIFAQVGESGFRKLETDVLSQFCKESNCVIATGGGCVTRAENYSVLRQNGRIYWIKRKVHLLPTDGRPLSQTNSLEKLYATRKPMYDSFSDFQIDNENIDEAISKIMAVEELA